MTVQELLDEGAKKLPRREGLPDPRREAAWLLARSLGVDEVWLRLHPDDEVSTGDTDRFMGWIQRRSAGVPAHHLTGICSFWGREFEVSPAVLVPRPETELLIQVALELTISNNARVLDVGTGSGCIAATLAAERPRWTVAAVDASPAALAVAGRNFLRHRVEVTAWLGHLTAAVGPPWDLVVANLPYIPRGELSVLPIEVRHDPKSALDGGGDGLVLIRELLGDLSRLLRPCGGAVLEIGEDQADAVAEIAASTGLAVARRIKDLAGVDRVVVLQPRS
jgi:release factor glutamine methyltransferase